MNKQTPEIRSVDDIVAIPREDIILLETRKGLQLGTARVTILDGGVSGVVEVEYQGRKQIVRNGLGPDAARMMAYSYHTTPNNY